MWRRDELRGGVFYGFLVMLFFFAVWMMSKFGILMRPSSLFE